MVLQTAGGDGKAPLRATQLKIVARQFSDDAYFHVAEIGFNGLIVTSGGRNSVTDTPEQINFPVGIESRAKRVDGNWIVEERRDLLFGVAVANARRNRRITVKFSFVIHGARFGQPGPRNPDASVGGKRFFQQRIENGIVELFPPARIERRIVQKLRVRRMIFHRGGFGSFVVRPTAQPLRGSRDAKGRR